MQTLSVYGQFANKKRSKCISIPFLCSRYCCFVVLVDVVVVVVVVVVVLFQPTP